MVLQTLTDINCVGGSRPAIPVSIISFHFIHLTSTQLVVQADESSTECQLWNERKIVLLLISIYFTRWNKQREGDHKLQLVLGTPFVIILVKIRLTLRSLTLYIYGAPILDVSRSHTSTQHSR